MTRHNPNALVIVAMLLVLAIAPAIPAVLPSQAQAPRAIVVDHTSVALFDSIPAQYITAARNLRMTFLDKSVGENISGGLTCLTGAGVPSCGITGAQPYQRNNWTYQWFDATGCGAWSDLETCFERQTSSTIGQYDVLMYGFSYMEVDQPGATDFFNDTPAGYEIGDAVAFLQARDKPVILWTSSLNRGADGDAESFNELMRGYAESHGFALFDLADILSHRPNGQACTSLAGAFPAICYPDYTTQTTSGGGHLSKAGQVHVAKALWVLMAQLAGWEPEAPPVTVITPTDEPTDTPTPTFTPIAPTDSPLPTPTLVPPASPTPVPTTVPPSPTPTHTPDPTQTPTATALPTTPPGGLCPFDARTSATLAAALQLWLEVWPSAQRYRDAANGSGSVEPLTEAEVSALIAACWTRANVLDARYYK